VVFAEHTFDDVIARRFRAMATGWHPTGELDDSALAAHIRALGIDILIDLGGYGDLGRIPACARRVAPVQINGSACKPQYWHASDGLVSHRPVGDSSGLRAVLQ
jgi:predicted O-linked N-acetylglucosamine transferase (SPINDLY family)